MAENSRRSRNSQGSSSSSRGGARGGSHAGDHRGSSNGRGGARHFNRGAGSERDYRSGDRGILLMAAIRKGTVIPGVPADRMTGVIGNAVKAGRDPSAALTGPAGALTSVSAGTIRAGSHPQITIQGAGILTVRCLIHRRIPILTGAPANLKCLKAWNGRCCRGMKKSV